jgi:hypothetical protein
MEQTPHNMSPWQHFETRLDAGEKMEGDTKVAFRENYGNADCHYQVEKTTGPVDPKIRIAVMRLNIRAQIGKELQEFEEIIVINLDSPEDRTNTATADPAHIDDRYSQVLMAAIDHAEQGYIVPPDRKWPK